MKSSRRSVGQRARIETLWQEKVVALPSRIPQAKWTEIQNEECVNHIVNSIREEIVQTAIDTLYKDYLTNRSCSFVVHCAHTAWLQLFNWMHLKRDPGESAVTVKERWTGDEEHLPAPRDNWVIGNVAIRKKSLPLPEPKICGEPCEQEDISRILPENISSPLPRESSGELTESVEAKIVSTSNEERSMQLVYPQDSEEVAVMRDSYEGEVKETGNGESSDRSEVLSIFTRTINMPKDQLPMPRWSNVPNHPILRNEVSQPKSWQSWKLDRVRPPRKLSLERLPPSRLDVKDIRISDQRASSNPREDTRKKASSKILSRKSKDVKSKRESKNDSLKKL